MGTLTFMVGCPDEAFAKPRPILEPVTGWIVHCNKPGTGQAASICNNIILGVSMIGTSEAFLPAKSMAVPNGVLFDGVSTPCGQCWSNVTHCPLPGPVPASAPTMIRRRLSRPNGCERIRDLLGKPRS